MGSQNRPFFDVKTLFLTILTCFWGPRGSQGAQPERPVNCRGPKTPTIKAINNQRARERFDRLCARGKSTIPGENAQVGFGRIPARFPTWYTESPKETIYMFPMTFCVQTAYEFLWAMYVPRSSSYKTNQVC